MVGCPVKPRPLPPKVSDIERAALAGNGGGGRYPDLVGQRDMTIARDPAKQRKAQLALAGFALDVEATEGEPAEAWLSEMLGYLFGIGEGAK